MSLNTLMTIGFLGCGNMGEAVLAGMVAKLPTLPRLLVYNRRAESRLALVHKYAPHVTEAPNAMFLIDNSDILILGLPAETVESTLTELRNTFQSLNTKKILVSLASGISLNTLGELCPNCRVVRAMPSTPVSVGEGISLICAPSHTPQEDVDLIDEIFKSVGITLRIPETKIDAYTAVTGCSPAFLFLLMEAMADGAVMAGVTRADAYVASAQAMLGAAKMVQTTRKHPGVLKDEVCSPGGVTIRGVRALEANGARSAVIEAVHACAERAKELSDTSLLH